MGKGLIPESIGIRKGKADKPSIRFRKSGLNYGWRRRIAEKIKVESPAQIEKMAEKLGGYSGIKNYLQEMAVSLGVSLDPQVTSDTHRIFRLPGSLNGKSGLAKTECTSLEAFDPFRESCLLYEDMVDVNIKCPLQLSLRGKSYKLSKERTGLPGYAAVYLICKGLAVAAS
jgi:DNA primase small subunit